jgi:hypothetical protein
MRLVIGRFTSASYPVCRATAIAERAVGAAKPEMS